ncbi:class I SAM-dependent methyltransferase [Modestobacter versicolor]|uniref:SAM-dependent methyltransferase n=1 Tax=Modestobacter versicolor TaxID=429133 RepID=A0A323VAW7_9ACTN|nr:class I SAM-dependent methyltransferase [Modestobacter versicolor]MBB3675998.1 SAM-dependent methyltransferase [Modestobacter versicolor]PZA21771.1 SAM-dependent methyltransferase [Modestobacter versicolor]
MDETTAVTGSWTDGDRYERYVGRWSRPVAQRFVAELGVPAGRRWLDVGCGTGVLTSTVLDHAAPASVLGVDRSPEFVAHAAAHVVDPRVAFRTADALVLPVEDAAVDVVVSGLVLNFLPGHPAAVAEWRRVVAPGGLVAAYVWDYAGGMELMRLFWAAATRVTLAAGSLDEGARFPVCAPGPLGGLFRGAGLTDVVTGSIDVPTVFADFDDYWTPFLGGTGHAPAYVATLGRDDRTALREALRADVPVRDDGSIALTARAWTVRGRVPG